MLIYSPTVLSWSTDCQPLNDGCQITSTDDELFNKIVSSNNFSRALAFGHPSAIINHNVALLQFQASFLGYK